MKGKHRQTEASINLHGRVNEAPEADPSKKRPVWTGMGMNARSKHGVALITLTPEPFLEK